MDHNWDWIRRYSFYCAPDRFLGAYDYGQHNKKGYWGSSEAPRRLICGRSTFQIEFGNRSRGSCNRYYRYYRQCSDTFWVLVSFLQYVVISNIMIKKTYTEVQPLYKYYIHSLSAFLQIHCLYLK